MNDYLNNLFQLQGKVAAVMGGGGHLCGEMARALANAGVKVAVLDKEKDKSRTVAAEIIAAGGEAIYLAHDAADKNAHAESLSAIIDAFGGVDILINGAGINAPTPFMEIPLDEWHAIIDSHVTATMVGCQIYGAHMLDKGRGSIINMSSASSGPPLSKAFTYSVAKAGILNLTKNLAREWATQNVRVNALRPGFFPTTWSQKHFIDAAREKAILGHTPMGRYGEPAELSGAVLWLASEASGFVTGAEIAVDGGFSCMTI